MVGFQDSSVLEEPCSTVSYNLHCTSLAAANSQGLSVYKRSANDPLWRLEANADQILKGCLRPGEEVAALDWAHPQYGALLAVGTNQGRVVLLSQRPRPEQPDAAAGAEASAMEEDAPAAAGWQLEQALLDAELSTVTEVRGMAFAPATVGLTLAVAHGDGFLRIVECSSQHPLLPHAKWTCSHELNLNTPPPIAPLAPSSAALPNSCGAGPRDGASTTTTTTTTQRDAACVSVCWQPQPDAVAPCLVAATTERASLWCYDRHAMDWACVCGDLEQASSSDSAPVAGRAGDIASVAWAPLVGKSAEMIALARGQVVRIFALQGDLRRPQVEQIGQDLAHDGLVWKLSWSSFALEIAASCEAKLPMPASVFIWRMNMRGDFGAEPAAVIKGSEDLLD